ncbi:hypothetical protein [Streptomyces niveus]|uniref:hypothetical protein n=1 Tax=Streptomyces niveus TaxID=193462 RepID=UPI003652A22E
MRLQLRIAVLDAERGAPVKGVLIDVWHGCLRTGPDGAGSAFSRVFALGLREELKEHAVSVTTLMPVPPTATSTPVPA